MLSFKELIEGQESKLSNTDIILLKAAANNVMKEINNQIEKFRYNTKHGREINDTAKKFILNRLQEID